MNDEIFSSLLNDYIYHFQAISNPTNEGLQEEAWRAVMPLVGQLKKFYEYATELGWLSPL